MRIRTDGTVDWIIVTRVPSHGYPAGTPFLIPSISMQVISNRKREYVFRWSGIPYPEKVVNAYLMDWFTLPAGRDIVAWDVESRLDD